MNILKETKKSNISSSERIVYLSSIYSVLAPGEKYINICRTNLASDRQLSFIVCFGDGYMALEINYWYC